MTPTGKRKERVTFQRRALDANGARLGEWGDDLPRWARVVPRTRGEVALQERLQGVQPIEVTILHSEAAREIDTDWRVLWNGKAFNVVAFTPSEDRAELNLLAQSDGSDA